MAHLKKVRLYDCKISSMIYKEILDYLRGVVERPVWPYGLIILIQFDHLQEKKFALKALARVGSFFQILKEPHKNCQRILKFCQSGEISPNLVTLV